MSAIPTPPLLVSPPHGRRGELVPPLENGDRLTQREFMRRYAAMPHLNKAQLIEGAVHMGSPVRAGHHGEPHLMMGGWVAYYLSKTRGVKGYDNATLRLDEENVFQPDAMLCLPAFVGGGAKVMEDDYLTGIPELVIEVAGSTVSIDLHRKLNAYRRNRVAEYIAWRTEDHVIDGFLWNDGEYVRQQPRDVDGRAVLVSRVFPGLWLDVAAMLEGDYAAVFAMVERGVRDEPEHAKLVERLRKLST